MTGRRAGGLATLALLCWAAPGRPQPLLPVPEQPPVGPGPSSQSTAAAAAALASSPPSAPRAIPFLSGQQASAPSVDNLAAPSSAPSADEDSVAASPVEAPAEAPAPVEDSSRTLDPLELPTGEGAWFGVAMPLENYTVQAYQAKTGLQPVSYIAFTPIPATAAETATLNDILWQVARANAVAVLTVEPWLGLDAVTDEALEQLAFTISRWDTLGAHVMIRFAHEMNGSWYPWGQKPKAYIALWRRMAHIMRRDTCSTLVWAPNDGEGYPWPTKGFEVSKEDWEAMDTNGDGAVNEKDDMYKPFYPGDEYVDWVGISVIRFGGDKAPFLKNVKPSPRAFTDKLTGRATNATLPNFYELYSGGATGHRKPLIIPETSAMYAPGLDPEGWGNLAIKSGWWEQAYNVDGDNKWALDLSKHFPMVKMICWFDQIKAEKQSLGHLVDWSVSSNATVLADFKAYVGTPRPGGRRYWNFADQYHAHAKATEQRLGSCQARLARQRAAPAPAPYAAEDAALWAPQRMHGQAGIYDPKVSRADPSLLRPGQNADLAYRGVMSGEAGLQGYWTYGGKMGQKSP